MYVSEGSSVDKGFPLTLGALRRLGIRIPAVRLAVPKGSVRDNFCVLTAKLLKLIRITNADGQYSSAPIAQMLMLAAGLFGFN